MRLRLASIAVVSASLQVPALAQTTTRVDVDSQGRPGLGNQSWSTSALSADGRFAVFSSGAPNLVPFDANGTSTDVFVHDRATGAAELVSVSTAGAQGNKGSGWVSMSSDARFVVFDSLATNLAGPTNGKEQIFLRDRVMGTTEMVSVDPAGLAGSLDSYGHSVSDDGRWVAFQSLSHFIDPAVPGARNEMYLRDRWAGTTVCISKTPAGTPSNGLSGFVIGTRFMSRDGRFVAFASSATNLGPVDPTTTLDVYVHDAATGARVIASLDATGAAANGPSSDASVSDDGRYVAFASQASDLVANDTNGKQDIFVRDLLTASTTRASVATSGAQGFDVSLAPWISASGDTVAFLTGSPLDPLFDVNDERDLYLRELGSGTTILASHHVDTSPSTLGVYTCSLSGDGSVASFWGELWGITPGDTGSVQPRHYVLDRDVHAPASSYCTAKTNSQGCVPLMSSAGFASLAGYDAHFLVATRVLNQKFGLLLWATQPGALAFGGGTLCVKAPLVRTPATLSGGSASGADCTGSYTFHWSQAYMQSVGMVAGLTCYAQWWTRDPGFAAPGNIGLSDAVQFLVVP